MTDVSVRSVVLDGLPETELDAAVTYLEDVQRECQLALVARDHGSVRPDVETLELAALADGLVAHLERVAAALRLATREVGPDGRVRLSGEMAVDSASDLSRGLALLAAANDLARRGGLMLQSDPNVTHVITWAYDELADQLHGRAARRYGIGS